MPGSPPSEACTVQLCAGMAAAAHPNAPSAHKLILYTFSKAVYTKQLSIYTRHDCLLCTPHHSSNMLGKVRSFRLSRRVMAR